jgi:large subunit ribosomal protein L25
MKIKLKAETRERKEKLPQDYTAAVVYGSKSDNILLKLNANELIKAYNQAGESSLIDLEIDAKDSIKVLVKDIQKHPVKDSIIHVDFYKVDMSEKLSTEIPLDYVGESKAVKELGALLVKNLDSLTVECLPGDLLDKIEVDISGLNSFGDTIRVKDVDVGDKLRVLDNPEDSVVTVVEPREEEASTDDELEELSGSEEEKEEESGEKEESSEEKREEKK